MTTIVTTGHERDSTLAPRAAELAALMSARGQPSTFVDREGQSLTKMMKLHSAGAVLVVSPGGTSLRIEDGSELRLNGGIGVLRLRTVLKGGRDNMVDACRLRAGDVFVDSTAGQLQDAMVASAAVGESGRIIALEASPLLYAVTSGRPVVTGDAEVDAALARVEVRLGDHTSLLGAMPTGSADVVYFDPMFRRPTKSSSGFERVLRGLGCTDRLSHEALVQARLTPRHTIAQHTSQRTSPPACRRVAWRGDAWWSWTKPKARTAQASLSASAYLSYLWASASVTACSVAWRECYGVRRRWSARAARLPPDSVADPARVIPEAARGDHSILGSMYTNRLSFRTRCHMLSCREWAERLACGGGAHNNIYRRGWYGDFEKS